MIVNFLALYSFFFVFLCLRYWALAEFSFWFFWRRDTDYNRNFRFQKRTLAGADIRRDLISSFRSFLVGALPPTLAHSILFRPLTHIYDDPLEHGLIWLLLSYPIIYHCHDIYYYWTHRLMHQPKIFKRIHSWHHRTGDTSPYSGYSMTAIESVIEYAWVFPLLFILPLNSWLLDLFWIHLLINNSLGHCGMDFNQLKIFKFPGERFIMKSHDHCYHHQNMNGNFGASLKIWDIWMKTAKTPRSSR